MSQRVAGIDIHKKVLMAVVATVSQTVGAEEVDQKIEYEVRRFGTGLGSGNIWWPGCGSAAWKRWSWNPRRSTGSRYGWIWNHTSAAFGAGLLQQSTQRAQERLWRRQTAHAAAGGRRVDPEFRARCRATRLAHKQQLVRGRVRLQNQLDLLEEARIKLSSVISDLLGASGRRILEALAGGETDPVKLAEWGDDRLKCSREERIDALRGRPEPMHVEILKLYLERLKLLDQVRYIEQGGETTPQAKKRRAQRLARALRTLGYNVALTPLVPTPGLTG